MWVTAFENIEFRLRIVVSNFYTLFTFGTHSLKIEVSMEYKCLVSCLSSLSAISNKKGPERNWKGLLQWWKLQHLALMDSSKQCKKKEEGIIWITILRLQIIIWYYLMFQPNAVSKIVGEEGLLFFRCAASIWYLFYWSCNYSNKWNTKGKDVCYIFRLFTFCNRL